MYRDNRKGPWKSVLLDVPGTGPMVLRDETSELWTHLSLRQKTFPFPEPDLRVFVSNLPWCHPLKLDRTGRIELPFGVSEKTVPFDP